MNFILRKNVIKNSEQEYVVTKLDPVEARESRTSLNRKLTDTTTTTGVKCPERRILNSPELQRTKTGTEEKYNNRGKRPQKIKEKGLILYCLNTPGPSPRSETMAPYDVFHADVLIDSILKIAFRV